MRKDEMVEAEGRTSISSAVDTALGRVSGCLEAVVRLTGSGLENVDNRPGGSTLQNLDSKLEWLNGQLLDLSRALEMIEKWIGA